MSESVTWPKDCELNRCKSCPEFKVTILDAMKQKEIQFSLWKSQVILVTKRNKEIEVVSNDKQVFSLNL